MAGVPQAAPMPQGVPLNNIMQMYSGGGGTPPAAAAPQVQPNFGNVQGGASTVNAPTGVGKNGFGLHPNVSHDEIVQYLLPRFRNVESGNPQGNYKALNQASSASGAYQYTDPTWNHHGGFPRAMDAPPEVQDDRMKQDLTRTLGRFGGDPFKTVANHYYPAWASDPTKWNQVPVNKYGKPIPNAEPIESYLRKVLPAERVDKYLAALGNTNRQGSGDGNTL
jgi:hypothetical protein